MRIWRQGRVMLVAAAALVVLACVAMPQLLTFPYRRQVGDTTIYAERPIAPAIAGVLARVDTLLAASAIRSGGYGRRIFLTDGGWRWRVLALTSAGAFAITRPLSEVIVVNRSDIAADRVRNGRTIAGERTLSGVLAHERTHGLIRARFGLLADARYPAWLREGYCDHVSGGGSLSDAEAERLIARGERVPALIYYEGRKRVAAELGANGGAVDRLFAAHARF